MCFAVIPSMIERVSWCLFSVASLALYGYNDGMYDITTTGQDTEYFAKYSTGLQEQALTQSPVYRASIFRLLLKIAVDKGALMCIHQFLELLPLQQPRTRTTTVTTRWGILRYHPSLSYIILALGKHSELMISQEKPEEIASWKLPNYPNLTSALRTKG